MILDGYGLNDKTEGNAIAQAKTPVMDELMARLPVCKGKCEWTGSRSSGRTDGKL